MEIPWRENLKWICKGIIKLKIAIEVELESVFTEGKANGRVYGVNGKSILCNFSDNWLILKLASTKDNSYGSHFFDIISVGLKSSHWVVAFEFLGVITLFL